MATEKPRQTDPGVETKVKVNLVMHILSKLLPLQCYVEILAYSRVKLNEGKVKFSCTEAMNDYLKTSTTSPEHNLTCARTH